MQPYLLVATFPPLSTFSPAPTMPSLSVPAVSPSPSNAAHKEPFLHAIEASRCHFKEFNLRLIESPMIFLSITPH